VADFQQLIAAYRQGGIVTHVAYIIGFPFDTPASVRQDLARLQQELAPEQASFFMLTPLPGSQDHRTLLEAGAYLDPDLNRYDSFHAATRHPRMTDAEWRGVYEEAWRSFYGLENMQAILRRVPPRNYWGVFMLFLWYKNSTMVEGGHPMVHGLLRLKGRRERRPGRPVETRWRYLARRAGDLSRTLRGWTAMALEMEELWLQTRSRSPLEQRVVDNLQRRYAHVQQWRTLRLAALQRAYARAAALMGKMDPRHAAWARAALPSRAALWVKQRNLFSHSLTYSRRFLQQFWSDTRAYVRQGDWHRIDVTRLALNLAQELSLFAAFIYAFCRQAVPHLFGGVSASRNLS